MRRRRISRIDLLISFFCIVSSGQNDQQSSRAFYVFITAAHDTALHRTPSPLVVSRDAWFLLILRGYAY